MGSTLIILVILPQSYWLVNSQYIITLKNIFVFIMDELRAVFGVFVLPGTIYFFINIYFFFQFSRVNAIHFYFYISFFNNSLIIFTTMGRQNNIINSVSI